MTYFWIIVGSIIGGVARYMCASFISTNLGEAFPWDTLLVNMVGAFIIGFFAALSSVDGIWSTSPEIRPLVIIGFCGSYTTFSTFSLQTLSLITEYKLFEAAANIILSVFICLLFVWIGHILGVYMNHAKGV